jgi:integrase
VRNLGRRFTDLGVEKLAYDASLAPPSGVVELRDLLCPGLLLRVTPKGTKSWSCLYRVAGAGGVNEKGRPVAGKQRRVTLGSYPLVGLAEAREECLKALRLAAAGTDPAEIQRRRLVTAYSSTLSKVQDAWLATIQQGQPRDRAAAALRLHVNPVLGGREVSSIRRGDVHQLLDGIVDAGLPGAARETRKLLSRFFGWCLDREIVTANPVAGLKRDDLSPNRDAGRELSFAELSSIWSACAELGPYGALVRCLMLTGQRRSEFALARSSWLEGHDLLIVPKDIHKSRRGHAIPLAEPVREIIEKQARIGRDSPLFTHRGKVISTWSADKARLDELVKLPPWRLHDLRVTCESRMARAGVTQDVRDAVLGHAKRGLQPIYNKYDYLAEKRAALETYAASLTAP